MAGVIGSSLCPMCFSLECVKDASCVVRHVQLPLLAAYAITIHRAQALTLVRRVKSLTQDCVILDVG